MAVPFSNTKLRVPKGFQNILEGLAREVLRCQPGNIYEFGATYLDTLVRNRTETGHDPAIHGARLEDRTYNNHAFKKGGVDPSDPQQQKAAVQIQTQYRQHSAEQAVGEMRKEDAAIKIQAGFRGYIDRQEIKSKKSESGSAKAEEEEEIDIDLNDPAFEDAALKIQAQFKGFKARKEIQTKKEPEEPSKEPQATEEPQTTVTEEVDIDLNDPDVSKAAIQIQAGFRGHLARQEMRKKQTPTTNEQDTTGTENATEQNSEQNVTEQNTTENAAAAQEEEEEVDIDLEDPEVEKAAIKIQASFKGFKSRQAQKQAEESTAGGSSQTLAAPAVDEEKASSPLPSASDYEPKNKKEEKPAQQEEEEIDIDLNDPEVEKAAIKIQAGFKGLKARKEMNANKPDDAAGASKEGESTEPETSTEVKEGPGEGQGEGHSKDDIDLNDPEVQQAAVKIQAGYKGFKTRQELKSRKAESTTTGAMATQGETGEVSGDKTEEAAAEEAKPEDTTTAEQAEDTTAAEQTEDTTAAEQAENKTTAEQGETAGEKAVEEAKEEQKIETEEAAVTQSTEQEQENTEGEAQTTSEA